MLRPVESMKKAARKYVSTGRGWAGFFEAIRHIFISATSPISKKHTPISKKHTLVHSHLVYTIRTSTSTQYYIGYLIKLRHFLLKIM